MLKGLLNITPQRLLTPMLILVGCLSHTRPMPATCWSIPLGGVIFYAAGRHPLAGIAAAFRRRVRRLQRQPPSVGRSIRCCRASPRRRRRSSTRRASVNPLSQLLLHGRRPRCSSSASAGSSPSAIVEPRLRGMAVDGDAKDTADSSTRRRLPSARAMRGGTADHGRAAGAPRAGGGACRRRRCARRMDSSPSNTRAADAVDRAAHLPAVPHPGDRLRLRRRHRALVHGRHRGDDQGDGDDGLLHRDGVLRGAVHRRVRAVEPRRAGAR